jgi:hypothetical protein
MFIKKVTLTILLVIVVGTLMTVSSGRTQAAPLSKNPTCPTEIQMGEVNIMIPARELSGRTEIQIDRCPGLNVHTTGGMMLDAPVVVNAVVHQDSLVITTHLLAPQPGPVDVTVYWRVD